jgi:hypothetical protein
MAKKDVPPPRQGDRHDPPATIGELRKLLAKMGNPWQPDPRLSDDEPMPTYPTGGDGSTEPVGQVVPEGMALDHIKAEPPTNPFLLEVWKKHGLYDKPREPGRSHTKPEMPDGNG